MLLDKNPHVRTVVNKVGAIQSEFRVFPMELLAGEHSTQAEVVQHGTRFKLDFAQVGWRECVCMGGGRGRGKGERGRASVGGGGECFAGSPWG